MEQEMFIEPTWRSRVANVDALQPLTPYHRLKLCMDLFPGNLVNIVG